MKNRNKLIKKFQLPCENNKYYISTFKHKVFKKKLIVKFILIFSFKKYFKFSQFKFFQQKLVYFKEYTIVCDF